MSFDWQDQDYEYEDGPEPFVIDYREQFDGYTDGLDPYREQFDGYTDGLDPYAAGLFGISGLDEADLTKNVRPKTKLKHDREAKARFALYWRLELLKKQREADWRKIKRLKEQIASLSNDNSSLYDMSQEIEVERLKTKHRRETERLENELTREKQAKGSAFELCRRLEEETVHLKSQAEDDKRENKRLKQQIASMSTDVSDSYDMSRAPRGVAVIINNIHFEDMADRDGAEGDTDRLQEVFESLGFTVVTFRDLDHAKMVATMKDQGKADHSNYDCFVCCIMSHGTMGKVYSSDDVGIDICELMKPVNAKKCPSLKGKPKLFFIQACMGKKTQGRESSDSADDVKAVPFICHEADFFLGLATVPGYVAWRDSNGAPYVRHLVKLLKDFGPTDDLSAIMAMVCDKMNGGKFGISSNYSTLRKKVVFKEK